MRNAKITTIDTTDVLRIYEVSTDGTPDVTDPHRGDAVIPEWHVVYTVEPVDGPMFKEHTWRQGRFRLYTGDDGELCRMWSEVVDVDGALEQVHPGLKVVHYVILPTEKPDAD